MARAESEDSALANVQDLATAPEGGVTGVRRVEASWSDFAPRGAASRYFRKRPPPWSRSLTNERSLAAGRRLALYYFPLVVNTPV